MQRLSLTARILSAGLFVFLWQIAVFPPLRAEAAERPNIVFIVADDLGWTDLGCYGSDYYETPHIDRLRIKGMKFTAAYTNGPNCAPTRAALLSGQQYPHNPVHTVGSPQRGKARFRKLVPPPNQRELPGEHITFAEMLQDSGYATAHMGKWHLGNDGKGTGPRDQGFDVNVGGYRAGHPSWRGGYFAPNNNPLIDDAREDEYLTDYMSRKAVEFIKANADGPFLLYLPYYAVHTPLQAPDERIARYRDKQPDGGHNNPTYAAMIESLDNGVGRILATLEQQRIEDETVVIFYSDNGGLGGYRRAGVIGGRDVSDNAPLHGGKGMLYEGGIRVPLIVRWPGLTEAGSTCDEPVIGIDFYPTFLDIAGLDPPEDYELDGVSFAPLLRDSSASLEREAIYWHFPGYLQASARKGTWRTTPAGAIRAGDWKLIEFFGAGASRVELYNLEQNIGETEDLSDSMPEKAAKLHSRLKAWRQAVDAPMPKPKG